MSNLFASIIPPNLRPVRENASDVQDRHEFGQFVIEADVRHVLASVAALL